jgi:hypothetical protein
LQASGVDYEDMLFFDNERWNITGASWAPRVLTLLFWLMSMSSVMHMSDGALAMHKEEASCVVLQLGGGKAQH